VRLSKHLSDPQPLELWDVESATLVTNVACVTARLPNGGAQRVLTFTDTGMGGDAPRLIVAACMNRTPPRVPVVGPRRSLLDPTSVPRPSSAPPPGMQPPPPPPLPPTSSVRVTFPAGAFPTVPGARPPPPPLNNAPSPLMAPPPPAAAATAEEEDLELAEAIRRSLLQEPPSDVPPPPAAEGDADVGEDSAASAPPLPTPAAPESVSGAAEAEAAWLEAQRERARLRKAEELRKSEEEDQTLCVICLSAGRTSGLLHGSSMHAVVCAECSPKLLGAPCPICRLTVERIIAIFA
jgi:hypothetical protein